MTANLTAALAAISPELQTVGVVLGVLGVVLGVVKLITDRQTELLKAHVTVTMLEHRAECPALAAHGAPVVQPVTPSESQRFLLDIAERK